jgi:TPR repeat protein
MRFLFVGYLFLVISSGAWADDLTTTNAPITPREFESYLVRAKSGDSDAEFMLGKCYYDGLGVAVDKAEALKWIEKAAEQGIPEAQMMVGINYWLGIDVKMDEAKGVQWFRKAAEQGEPGSFFYLGASYYLGKGVKQDYVQSYKWTLLYKESKSTFIHNADIDYKLADLEQKMTPEQISEAEKMAKETEARLSKKPIIWVGP